MHSLITFITRITPESWGQTIYVVAVFGLVGLMLGASYVLGGRDHGRVDYRKARPYSGYEHFEFEVPVGKNGDAYDRCVVRVEELRQSCRIIRQCLEHMPAGPYKADHPLTCPPPRERMLQDIETLITHFLAVSWGPVIPPGESIQLIEATKGINSYYLTSDGNTMSYRTRIRTPSFPHLQMIPEVVRGRMVPDLVAHLASIDFVMADVDR